MAEGGAPGAARPMATRRGHDLQRQLSKVPSGPNSMNQIQILKKTDLGNAPDGFQDGGARKNGLVPVGQTQDRDPGTTAPLHDPQGQVIRAIESEAKSPPCRARIFQSAAHGLSPSCR